MRVCYARFPVSRDNSVTVFADKAITSRREIENILRMIALDADLYDEPEQAADDAEKETPNVR